MNFWLPLNDQAASERARSGKPPERPSLIPFISQLWTYTCTGALSLCVCLFLCVCVSLCTSSRDVRAHAAHKPVDMAVYAVFLSVASAPPFVERTPGSKKRDGSRGK